MKKIVTYYANDGKVFSDEAECLEYEKNLIREQKQQILEEIVRLDLEIWQQYHPQDKDLEVPPLHVGKEWLRNDIIAIVLKNETAYEEIVKTIEASSKGKEILKGYLDLSEIQKELAIHKDLETALKEHKVHELSSLLRYSFYGQDLKQLALLHKKNRFRKKIENLLTNCNFHHECGRFVRKEYEEFLNI